MNRLESELYALTHRGNAGDAAFYAKVCARRASVLELGSGYGRLLPALAGASRDLVGLEREAEFLRAARAERARLPAKSRARVELVRGDMQSFSLGRRFERILLPYNGLYCLTSRAAQLRCFRAVRAHLEPKGEFWFDVWAADRFHEQAASSAYHDDEEPILALSHRQQVWDVFERSRLSRRRQRLDVDYGYLPRGRGPSVVIRIEQRYVLKDELESSLARAGLRLQRRFGGFDERAFRRGSAQLLACAVAAE